MSDVLSKRDPDAIVRFIHRYGPWFEGHFRPRVQGVENIPEGPALYVGNHNGGLLSADTLVAFKRVLEQRGFDDIPFGLAHDTPMRVPLIGRQMQRYGAIPANHASAHAAFSAGHKVLVYPGGDEDSLRPFVDRDRIEFAGRVGYIRLALRSGVPIVPLVAAGAQSTFVVLNRGRRVASWLGLKRLRINVFPFIYSWPFGLSLGPPPFYWPFPTRFFIEFLPPIQFSRAGEDAANDTDYVKACDAEVRERMQQALTRLASDRAQASR